MQENVVNFADGILWNKQPPITGGERTEGMITEDDTSDLSDLKKLIALETTKVLSPELMDELVRPGKILQLETYEAMIDAGVYDPNIYIVKKGLIRGTHLDKNIEKTSGFALPGTILFSFHCYYGGSPSYYRFEACCPTEVVRIPKEHLEKMLRESHEFALWLMSVHQNQLYYNECKNQMLSGDAKSRLLHLTKHISGKAQPEEEGCGTASPDYEYVHSLRVKTMLYTRWNEIFRLVPSKIIASYLGITEQHLSKIKKELLTE